MREGDQCRARVLAGGGGVGWRIAAAAGRAARTAPGRSCSPADCVGEWVRGPSPSGDVRGTSWSQPGRRPPLRPARWPSGSPGAPCSASLSLFPGLPSPSPGPVRVARLLFPPPDAAVLGATAAASSFDEGSVPFPRPPRLAPALVSPTSPPVPDPAGSSEAAGSRGCCRHCCSLGTLAFLWIWASSLLSF